MQQFIVKRFLVTIPVMLFVGVVTFLLIQLTPGDPTAFFVSPDATAVEVQQVRERLGLEEPIPVRFALWFGSVLQGDLGLSFYGNRPVLQSFLRVLPPTLYLMAASLLLAVITAIPIGIVSAIRQNSWIDKSLTVFVLIGVSLPNFWLGMLLVLGFSVTLGWFPAQGFVRPEENVALSLRHLILPAITLGYSGAALIARMTRSAMLDEMRQDYVRTARSKGLQERIVVYGHALQNAGPPILTVVGLTVASLISGSVVVEKVFNYPGVGRLVVDSILRRDYPVIQGSLLLIAGATVMVNLLVDLMYALLDPRIRYD